MATIKDIAAYTGVSPTTVSNVIHGRSGRVSEETVHKIQDAIEKLGYVPNMSARSLVSSSSKVIALINHINTRKDSNFMDDPFQASLIGIIESALRENGYYLMVRTVDTADELLAFLRNWNVDGLFVTGIFRDSFFDTLSTLDLPMVFIDSYVKHPNFYNVGLEDFNGSFLATSHLIENGHRKIAFTSPSIRDGGAILDLTGIVASADIMAAGIMTGLRDLGVRVPDDLSIVGFDDLVFSQMITPPLTTIHQNMPLKGQTAVDFMLQKLEGRTLSQTEVILPTYLVKRQSVRNLRNDH